MRHLARLFAEATETNVASQESVQAFQIIAASPAMESFVEQITAALPERTVELVQLGTVSQESQQQDQVEKVENLQNQYEELLALLNPKEQTSTVQVFLFDEVGMASGHAGSAAALKAMVKASMNTGRRVVVAMSRSWQGANQQTPADVSEMAVEAQRKLMTGYLISAGIPAFDSFEDLTAFLRTL